MDPDPKCSALLEQREAILVTRQNNLFLNPKPQDTFAQSEEKLKLAGVEAQGGDAYSDFRFQVLCLH